MHQDLYDALVVLHALVAVVSFGAIAMSGVYGATARSLRRPGSLDEVRRWFDRPPRTGWAVLAVAPLGAAALAADPHGEGFSQAWIVAGLFLWLVASVVWLWVVRPGEKVASTAVRGATGDHPPPGSAAALAGPGRRLVWASTATSGIFVVALALMVTQP